MNFWIIIFSTLGVIFLFAEIKSFPSSVTNNMDLTISQLSHWAWWMRAVGSARIQTPCYTRQLLYDTPDSWSLVHQTAALWYTRQLISGTPDSCSMIHQTADLWYTRQLISGTPDSCSMTHQTADLWYTRQLLSHTKSKFCSIKIKFSFLA
jgi:hypothetical protein